MLRKEDVPCLSSWAHEVPSLTIMRKTITKTTHQATLEGKVAPKRLLAGRGGCVAAHSCDESDLRLRLRKTLHTHRWRLICWPFCAGKRCFTQSHIRFSMLCEALPQPAVSPFLPLLFIFQNAAAEHARPHAEPRCMRRRAVGASSLPKGHMRLHAAFDGLLDALSRGESRRT